MNLILGAVLIAGLVIFWIVMKKKKSRLTQVITHTLKNL